ncbi:MAG: family peptidase, partial [Microbacteriaceae bacterium]|nr:family peptidase [Microbacteriaceae bacterium]
STSRPSTSRPSNRRATPKPKKPFSRRALPKVLSFGAMVGAAGLLVATSLPANAFMPVAADAATTVAVAPVAVQKLAPVTATATTAVGARDKYTVVSLAQQMALKYMNSDWSYTNDPNGTIQWPFPVQVPIATGFGPRHVAGCSFCSTFHEGVDFDPGQGVAIGSIADGVVSQVVESHAGLGNHVVVDHVINGVKVQSVYGHMLDGSIRVVVGQAVTVTQELGQVGSTGESTGAHLHLEIHVNDVPIDPFAWLKANAN